MRKLLKKGMTLAFAMALAITSVPYSSIDYLGESVKAEEINNTGANFLTKVKGDYQPLFNGGIFDTKYDHYFYDYASAVMGESYASDMVSVLKSSVSSETYGENAAEGSFFCGFTENIVNIEFGGEDGSEVTFTDGEGQKITHTYSFVKDARAVGQYYGQEMGYDGYLFKSNEDVDDNFKYLFMCEDTPDTTFHLEFRYGDTEENVLALTDGKYKNWLAAGIESSAFSEENEATIQNVICLYVVENILDRTSEETVNQRKAIVGRWDCDFTDFRSWPGYEKAEMYIDLSADGSGKTYMDSEGNGNYKLISEYTFFSFDNNKTDNEEAGVYISYNEAAGTITPGSYKIEIINGKKNLVFTSAEGVIKYIYRDINEKKENDNTQKVNVEENTKKTSVDNTEKKETKVIKNKSKKILIKKLKIKGKKSIKFGKKIKLKVMYSPKKVSNKKVKWSVSNKKYASISSKGVLKAKKAGVGKKITVRCMALDGSKKVAKLVIKIKK